MPIVLTHRTRLVKPAFGETVERRSASIFISFTLWKKFSVSPLTSVIFYYYKVMSVYTFMLEVLSFFYQDIQTRSRVRYHYAILDEK